MASALEKKQAEVTEKANRLKEFFESKKKPEGFVMNKAETEKVQEWNKELDALSTEVKNLTDLDAIEQKNLERIQEQGRVTRPGGYSGGQMDVKTGRINTAGMGHDGASLDRRQWGDIFTESKAYKERGNRTNVKFVDDTIETKTLFSTTAGWDPFVTRLSRVALSPQQQPKLIDAFPMGTTTQHSIKYMLETTYTNSTAGTSEGSLFPESALALTEELVPVVKIAGFLPVTDEQLADEMQSRDYLNSRLEFQLRATLDSQLINGNGTAPQLTGLANISGISTQAQQSGEAIMDTLLRAQTKVRTVGFCEPSANLMNPNDWMLIQLLKTADGLYIWGHPATGGPSTMWGLPVITSTFITAGTAYVGDLVGNTMLFMRQGMEMETSNSHSDFFQRGQLAIRVLLRCALVCFRSAAICQCTGLA